MKPGYTVMTYTTTNIMVSSVYSKMEDERGLVHRNLDELCHIVPHLENDCKDHPESCSNSRIQLETVERAMENGVKTLNFINYVCDVGDRPDAKNMMERCSANNSWKDNQPYHREFTVHI